MKDILFWISIFAIILIGLKIFVSELKTMMSDKEEDKFEKWAYLVWFSLVLTYLVMNGN